MAADESVLVLAILGLTLALGGTFILARVITRTLIKPQFGLDDIFIIVTWFILLGFNTAYFVAVSHGYGRPAAELALPDLLKAAEASIIGEVLIVWAYPTGKAAIAYLLMRLFPGKTLKWILWSFVAANAFFFYLNGILFLVQCRPVTYQWDQRIEGGTCWNPKVLVDWGYITGAVGAATDFVFAVIPWFYIAKLHMATKNKIIVGVALSAGLLPFICSILKIHFTSNLGTHADPTYDTIPLLLSGASETCAINIAACIPTLRPLYRWFTGEDSRNFSFTRYTRNSEYAKSGSPSSFLGVFSRRRYNDTKLSSLDGRNHIIQHRTYDVSIEESGHPRSKSESTTITSRTNIAGQD